MDIEQLKNSTMRALKSADKHRDRQRAIFEFGDLLERVIVVTEGAAPDRVKAKARAFLAILGEKADLLGEQMWHESFLLNVVGEAMVRADYVADGVLDYVKSGLYFYGLRYVERVFRGDMVHALEAHAEALGEFTNRETVRAWKEDALARLAEGRPFCLVYAYTNALKKRAWAARRRSEDACDVSVSYPAESEVAPSASAVETAPASTAVSAVDLAARVALLLRVFATKLDDEQRRIYLARHHVDRALEAGSGTFDAAMLDRWLEAGAKADDGDPSKETWSELAERFGSTEKTVKREYLRALMILLQETSRAVFGDICPSNFVRKNIETLRAVIQDKELRIKDNSGRGLGKTVARWEVALRFVLNHNASVREAVSGDESPGVG